ncbi:MAG: hypothetical protein P8049_09930 [Gemmatimonadota bacterium]
MTKSDLQLYSKTELEDARTKGQVIGWLQGAGAVIALGLLLSVVGWIPTILAVGGIGYLLYRALR